MGSKKLLFFDVDGTIWDFYSNIPQSTLKAFELAKKNGHKIFINTGRSNGHLFDKNLLSIGFDGIVAACSTTIEYQGELIFKHFLDNDQLCDSLKKLEKYKFRSILEGYNYLYLDNTEWDAMDSYYRMLSRDLGEKLKSTTEHWGKWDMICKFSSDTTGGDMKAGMDELSDIYDFVTHNENVVEVIPKGFGKGKGVKYLCEYLGCDIEDTFSFGDSLNDMDMILTAGCGVAMGNACDEIKEAADYVTTPMKQDGIMNALKHFELI